MAELPKDSNHESALSKITKDRTRTNLLKKHEQNLIAYLVQRIPAWITSDMLTFIGFSGSIVIAIAFILATYVNRYMLLFGIVGLVINWFGDSLDGRLAYYRNKPRKWYGFSLDFTIDWLNNIIMGLGFAIYFPGDTKLIVFLFIMLYGWAMIIALLRYKLINKYTIDSSFLGPTEVRFIISGILILEVLIPGALIYLGSLACVILFILNVIDFKKLLVIADKRDIDERNKKDNNTK